MLLTSPHTNKLSSREAVLEAEIAQLREEVDTQNSQLQDQNDQLQEEIERLRHQLSSQHHADEPDPLPGDTAPPRALMDLTARFGPMLVAVFVVMTAMLAVARERP